MHSVLGDLLRWWRAGQPVGLATVTGTWSSAPRQAGAAMLVGPDGTAVGSVSGGCVEGAVYELCREAAASGRAHLARFGVTDADAVEVGLPCGGTIEVFVERIDADRFPQLALLAAEVEAGRPAALLTCVAGGPDQLGRHLVLTGDGRHGSLGGDRLDGAAADDGRGLLAAGHTGLLHYGPDGQRRGSGVTVLLHAYAPPARMIVFGATDHAAAVARIGTFLGYRVTVCDARETFATAQRLEREDGDE